MKVCPIHSAAAAFDQKLAVDLARIVLEAGADPNAKQQGGYTAVHEAARGGNVALITLLFEHGADPSLANDKGEVPLDLARSRNQAEVVSLLQRGRA